MNYKVLARKWRPKVFADVIGQQPVVQALQYALDAGKLHHAYLFSGTRGVGKTTLARILAKALSCEAKVVSEPCCQCANCHAIDAGNFADVIEVDAASRTRVEDTKELLDNVAYAPVHGRFKIYIIDEVHMLSNHSFNALLKTLEEPPEHVKFLFATTEVQKLPITILSRCLQFNLKVIPVVILQEYLQKLLITENINYETDAVERISMVADGSIRDALTLLEQVIALGKGSVTSEIIWQVLGIANYALLLQLLKAIINQQIEQVFTIIEQLNYEFVDFNKILQEIMILLHKISVVQVLPNYLEKDHDQELLELSTKIDPAEVQLLYQIAVLGRKDLAYAPDHKIGFEMVILRMLAFQPVQITTKQEKISTVINKTSAEPITTCNKIETEVIPDWGELIYEMELTGLTKIVAQHCIIKAWKQEKIVLTLDVAHKALLQPHHEKRIQQALSKYLGKNINLIIEIDKILGKKTVNEKLLDQQIQKQKQAEQKVQNNTSVKDLLSKFDAKLERVIIKE